VTAPKVAAFERHHHRYDEWFDRHAPAYHSELLAVRALLPWQGLGLAIGVGTGRFAAPLGIEIGIDPAREVLAYATKRGISAIRAVAEVLPFVDDSFDYALAVTVICFVDDAEAMISEAKRVLRPKGDLIIGFIDRTSSLGQQYEASRRDNVFYRDATFFSATEVDCLLADSGFQARTWVQTLHRPLLEVDEIEAVRPGYGDGAFVVVRANCSK
jgi:SAM-dependent methyltransferase